MTTGRAVGVGELLWDLLPDGPRLGGAPFNVIAHLSRLGFATSYVSSVGDDEFGRRALAELRRLSVDPSLIGTVDLPTGTVNVTVDGAGIPAYEIVSPVAYERLACPVDAQSTGVFDVLVFGTLAQRFPDVRRATHELAIQGRAALRLYDVNLREGCWTPSLVEELIGLATILKLNEAEAAELGSALSLPAASISDFAAAVVERFGVEGVCVTKGPDGAALLLAGCYAEAPAVPVTVVDTVGAGDAVSAGLVAGITAGRPVEEVLRFASRLAGFVASHEGAIPDWQPSDLEG